MGRRVRGRTLVVAAVGLTLAAGCSSGGAAGASPLEKPVLNVAVDPTELYTV